MILRRLVSSLALIAVLTIVGCGSHDSRAPLPDSTGYAGGVSGLDRYDPLTYFDAWSGDLSPHAAITEDEWKRLILRQRILGLKGLSDSEREALLRGGVKAYLTLVSGTEKRYVADGLGSEDSIEHYHATGALNIVLDADEQHADGATFDFAGNVQPATGGDVREVFRTPAPDGWAGPSLVRFR